MELGQPLGYAPLSDFGQTRINKALKKQSAESRQAAQAACHLHHNEIA